MEFPAPGRHYAFVFICQAGELEFKAAFLAASLKRYLRCRYELIAALPHPPEVWGTPSPRTLTLLAELGVRTAPITNEFGIDYPHGNKLACLEVPTAAEKIVFLDSDIVALREFTDEPRFGIAFNAKPADLQTYSTDEGIWGEVYETAGAPFPSLRVPSSVSREIGLPYFNAGVIAVNASANLGPVWRECARRVRANERLAGVNSPPPHKHLWLDQISLPVALHRLGLEIDCLDERYNFPTHLKPLNEEALPFFCHYHHLGVIAREPALRDLLHSLGEEYSALADLAQRYGKEHFQSPPPARKSIARGKPADLLITGIPRSGTSYLCHLLHRYSNCVILNEPAEILQILANETAPWGIPLFYRNSRSHVERGIPLQNKLDQGKVTQDTALNNELSPYLPEVDNEQFILGTKNTLAYLARLEALRRVMPHARVIACVRDPFDAIGSWKTSFPHLRDARLSQFAVGKPEEPWLSNDQRRKLELIAATEDPAQRRALLWNYLGERILEQGDAVIRVNYADLVHKPAEVLARILGDWDAGVLREPITSSQLRNGKERLDAADRQAIRAICSQTAAELGLF